MTKRKIKKKSSIVNNANRGLLIHRIQMIEDMILVAIMVSALWVFSTQLNSHFTLPKLALISLLISSLQITFLIRLKLDAYNYLPKLIWLPLSCLVLWWLLSTTQASHLQTALEGQYGRYNALYTHLLWVIFFINLASMQLSVIRIKRILLILLLLLLPVCLYAVIQFIGMDIIFNIPAGIRPPSSVGNPVALAAILMMYFPFAIILSNNPKLKKYQIIFYLSITLIFIATIILSGSRGPWLGSIAAISLLVFLKLYTRQQSRKFLNYYTLIAVLIGCAILFALIFNLDSIKERFLLSTTINERWIYYTIAWDMFQDSPLFGYGFESFQTIYPHYRPNFNFQINLNTTPTMVHNDYLQLLVDNGFFALFFYLIFIFSILWSLFKALRSGDIDKLILIAMIAAVISYQVQALVGWLEVASSTFYWLLLGLSMGLVLYMNKEKSTKYLHYRHIMIIVTVVSFFLSLYYGNIMMDKVNADYSLRQAQKNIRLNFNQSRKYIADINRSQKENPYYQGQIGHLYSLNLMMYPNKIDYKTARKHLLKAIKLSPNNIIPHIHNIENEMIALQKKIIYRPSIEALDSAKEIVCIDPNNPSVHLILARFYGGLGKHKEKFEHLKRIKVLESNTPRDK